MQGIGEIAQLVLFPPSAITMGRGERNRRMGGGEQVSDSLQFPCSIDLSNILAIKKDELRWSSAWEGSVDGKV